MRLGRGIFEIESKGKKYGFKFGNYASAITQQKAGKKITEVFASMFVVKDGVVDAGPDSLMMMIHYFYGAAVSYAISKEIPEPGHHHVADWMEEIGDVEVSRIYLESLRVPNDESPETKTNPGTESTTA